MRWLTLLLLLTLAGCGFHLRGTWPHATLQEPALVKVSGASPYRALVRELNEALALAGLQNPEAAAGRHLTLEILDEQHVRRVAARARNLDVAEYELHSRVSYMIMQQDTILLAPSDVQAERTWQFDRLALAGNSEQEDRLRAEMQNELAAGILGRVRALLNRRGDSDQ